MSAKIPYELLADQVDRLFEKDFPEEDETGISMYCEEVASFIENSGWTVEEYTQEFVRRGVAEFLAPDITRMN